MAHSKESLFVVTSNTKKERNALYEFCKDSNIPILYLELFKERKIQHLWGVSKSGVGLVGTIIARNISKEHICHSVEALKNNFQKFIQSIIKFKFDKT